MTVGEPEINLNTWGLKYVKKDQNSKKGFDVGAAGGTVPKEKPTASTGSTPSTTKTPHGLDAPKDALDLAGNDPTNSKNLDTTTSYGEGSTGTQGEGANQGDRAQMTGIGGTKKNPNADEQGNQVKFKKPKEGTGGAARDIKRAMDLAILKCKNFKIKYHNYKNPNSHDAGAGDNPVWQKDVESKTTIEDASGKEEKPQKVADRYKSDEIVAKAIELINEAYDQIGKDDIRGRHDDRSDDETPEPKFTWGCPESGCDFKTGDEDKVGSHVNSHDKDSKTNKADSAVTTSTEGAFNHVYSDVHEKKKQEEDEEDNKERNRRSEDEDSKEDWAKHN